MAQTHYWTGRNRLESQVFYDAARKDYEQKQQKYDAVVAEANANQGLVQR